MSRQNWQICAGRPAKFTEFQVHEIGVRRGLDKNGEMDPAVFGTVCQRYEAQRKSMRLRNIRYSA
jgi:hypothetical protein